jgi:hypothetical protein
MANGDTLTTNVAETVQELITATISLMPQKAPMLSLVTRMNITKGHDRLEIPRVASTSSVQTPTEGDEIVLSSQFDLTSTTIQPTHRVLAVRVHERAMYFSKDDLVALISEELAQSQAQDIDTDLTAEFTNFHTDNDSGATNTDLTLAFLRTARRRLYAVTRANGGPAPEPVFTVIAPIPEENLLENMGLSGSLGSNYIPEGLSKDVISNYYVPQVVGLKVFRDGYMTESGGDFYCGMFSKKALWLAVSKDWDMKTFEVPNWVGTIIRSVADYNSGVGAYPHWGAQVLCDGA